MWKDQLVTVDYSQWKVMLEPGELPEPNGKDVFVLSPAGEFTLPLTIAEQSVECRVDPLFAGGLILPTAAGRHAADGGRAQGCRNGQDESGRAARARDPSGGQRHTRFG